MVGCFPEKRKWCLSKQVCQGSKVQSALSGPGDWILRYIGTCLFAFFKPMTIKQDLSDFGHIMRQKRLMDNPMDVWRIDNKRDVSCWSTNGSKGSWQLEQDDHEYFQEEASTRRQKLSMKILHVCFTSPCFGYKNYVNKNMWEWSDCNPNSKVIMQDDDVR